MNLNNTSNRKYYGQRTNDVNSKISFEELKELFLSTYLEFEYSHYFDRAELNWGKEVGLFIYLKTKTWNIWPIKNYIEFYDEATLFTVIEFLYDYVAKPGFRRYEASPIEGKIQYREAINKILEDYNGGYRLSKDGEILKLSPSGFEPLIHEAVKTNDPKNIDLRIKYAISKFLRYSSSTGDKKEAVRTLADVLEFLRKDNIKLPKKDDSELFQIINKFDIRHHNQTQKGDYDKEVWYDWMFYTFLASIHVLLKFND